MKTKKGYPDLYEKILQKEQELARAIDEVEMLRRKALDQFVEHILDLIRGSIFQEADILAALCRKKIDKHHKQRPRWRMKGNQKCVYTQGQLPQCILVEMRKMDLDPKLPEDREKFFNDRMERCDGEN